MDWYLGTDEAGYGPYLGPLVITATLWRCAESRVDLDRVLEPWISRQPTDDGRVILTDSKQLFRSGHGLANLERNALGALLHCPAVRQRIESRMAGSSLSMDCLARAVGAAPDWSDEVPWHQDQALAAPLASSPGDLAPVNDRLAAAAAETGIGLIDIQSQIVFPAKWNALLADGDNKGATLSRLTLELAARLMVRQQDGDSLLLHCDKHGGRNYYVPVLQPVFPDYLIEVRREGAARSLYRFGPAERRVEARFVAKGESFLPSALASMVSKYLREFSMRSFNDYWTRRVPGLRPTAGYAVDARRFRRDIQATQRRLRIPDRILWRSK